MSKMRHLYLAPFIGLSVLPAGSKHSVDFRFTVSCYRVDRANVPTHAVPCLSNLLAPVCHNQN